MEHVHDIIKKPVLTEKSYDFIPQKRYTFLVDVRANKTQIKHQKKKTKQKKGLCKAY